MAEINYMGKQIPVNVIRVWCESTDVLKQGYPMCFNDAYVGDGLDEADPGRVLRVVKPTAALNYNFAGWVIDDGNLSAAKARFIDLAVPGGAVVVWTDQNVTKGDYLTARVGEYVMGKAGFRGRGTVRALQTIDRSATPGPVLALADDGIQSGLTQELGLAAAGGAVTGVMTGGVVFQSSAVTLASAATFAVGDGAFVGQRMRIVCDAALTTNDLDVTVTKHSVSSPEHLFFDADGEEELMEWNGLKWIQIATSAATS